MTNLQDCNCVFENSRFEDAMDVVFDELSYAGDDEKYEEVIELFAEFGREARHILQRNATREEEE